jgi:hypothetical protein
VVDTAAYLTALLDADTSGILSQFDNAEAVVGRRLNTNRRLFDEKMAVLGLPCPTIGAVNDVLADKVLAIERSLARTPAWQPLHTAEGMAEAAHRVFASCPKERKRGMYLTERSAGRILNAHLPVRVEGFARAHGRKMTDDPLSLLALTRHTESKQWQEGYLDILRRVDADDFEERDFRHCIYDSSVYGDLLSLSGPCQKPWRISHNKETGIINFFTLDENHGLSAPLLQMVAVSMHYFFEVTSAGSFFRRIASEYPSELGLRVSRAITTNTEQLAHFRPNVYSEHVFWDEAMELFTRTFSSPEISFFADAFYTGDELTSGSPSIASLNVIDVLWNVNLLDRHGSKEYFGQELSPFLYHFRDAIWYDILRELAGYSPADMRDFVMNSLDMGDLGLTKTVVEQRVRTA